MTETQANRLQIANIDLPVADKEETWAVPKGCQWFNMQTRDGAEIRMSTIAGHAAGKKPPYFTVKPDIAWDEKQLLVKINQGLVLFFASSVAGKTVEILLGIYDPSLEESGAV